MADASNPGTVAAARFLRFGDPTIGANTYSHSAFCDTEWSKDGQHLNDAGKAIMGRIEAQAVAKFLAARGAK